MHYKTYDVAQAADTLGKLLVERTNLFDKQCIGFSNIAMREILEVELSSHADVVYNLEFADIVSFMQSLKDSSLQEIWQKHEYTYGLYDLLHRSNIEALCPKSYSLNPILKSNNHSNINHFRYQYAQEIGNLFNQYQFYRPQIVLDWQAGRRQQTPDAFLWQADIYGELDSFLIKNNPNKIHLSQMLTSSKNRGFVENEAIYLIIDRVQPDWFYDQINLIKNYTAVHLISVQPNYDLLAIDFAQESFADTVYTLAGQYNQQHLIKLETLNFDLEVNPNNNTEVTPEKTNTVACQLESSELSNIQLQLIGTSQTEQAEPPINIEPAFDEVATGDHSNILGIKCHTYLSEIITARDWIITHLERDPNLAADDFLIVCENLQIYSDTIHHVFGDSSLGKLPYSIAEPRDSADIELECILQILRTPSSEYDLTLLRKLVVFSPMLYHFGLNETEWERIIAILSSLSYSSGLYQQFPAPDNSLQNEFNRLVLSSLSATNLTSEHTNLDTKKLLAAQNILAFLTRSSVAMSKQLDIESWVKVLTDFTATLYRVNDESENTNYQISTYYNGINGVLKGIEEISGTAKFDRSSVAKALEDRLKFSYGKKVAVHGSVLFASLGDIRFRKRKHICFLGMQHEKDGQFKDPNNIIVMYPQPGDHNPYDRMMYGVLANLVSAQASVLFTMTMNGKDEAEFIPLISYLLKQTNLPAIEHEFLPEQRAYDNSSIQAYALNKFDNNSSPIDRARFDSQSKLEFNQMRVTSPLSVSEIATCLRLSMSNPNLLGLSYHAGTVLRYSHSQVDQNAILPTGLENFPVRRLAYEFIEDEISQKQYHEQEILPTNDSLQAQFYAYVCKKNYLVAGDFNRHMCDAIIDNIFTAYLSFPEYFGNYDSNIIQANITCPQHSDQSWEADLYNLLFDKVDPTNHFDARLFS